MEGRENEIWKGENTKNMERKKYEIWQGENMKVAIREAHLLQLQLPLLHSPSNILNFLSNLKHSEQTFILREMSETVIVMCIQTKRAKYRIM